MTSEHASFERLSDLADGHLGPRERVDVERHVAECAACRETLAGLRQLLERAASLAAPVDPPGHAWSVIRGRLQPHRSRWTEGRRWQIPSGWLVRAAAAVLLVAASSSLTVIALRSRQAPSDVVAGAAQPTALETPVALRAVDETYAAVLDELTTTLRAQRAALAPGTIATLERTLRIIDEAIAEARSALAADPGNAALLDVLSANYEQKVQLLRRASELPART